MKYFLSDDEVVELTGFKQASKQARYFALNNIPFEMSALGKPRVIRTLLEQRHSPHGKATKQPLAIVLPN